MCAQERAHLAQVAGVKASMRAQISDLDNLIALNKSNAPQQEDKGVGRTMAAARGQQADEASANAMRGVLTQAVSARHHLKHSNPQALKSCNP
jgi:hypothetical protein